MRSQASSEHLIESCCDSSSSTSSVDSGFHLAGRWRKYGWHMRRSQQSRSPPLVGGVNTPITGSRAHRTTTVRSRLQLATLHRTDTTRPPTPPGMSSQSSVMGFYSIFGSLATVEHTVPHRHDRATANLLETDIVSLTPDMLSSHPMSPISNQPARRTVYTAGVPTFSAGDLSVLVDEHKVLQTTNVTLGKLDGHRVINDYVVLHELGRGSYGKVQLVRHSATGKLFAMKVLEPFAGNTSTISKRLKATRREIAVMKRVSHPHMVKLHEVLGDRKRGRLYMVMQYVSGGSIAKKVSNWTIEPVPETVLRYQARQLLSALKYMHINGVVHRDIKPENILVDERNNVFLADFGVSAICTSEGVAGVEGTPAFMAPELCRGESAVSGDLVDIWALGVSLYQLMYGRPPFTASTQLKLLKAITEDPLVFPDDVPEYIHRREQPVSSPEFKEAITGMLRKNPAERWNVRTAIDCTWLAWCSTDTPSTRHLSHDESMNFIGIMDARQGHLSGDILPTELEEAIASLSTSDVEP